MPRELLILNPAFMRNRQIKSNYSKSYLRDHIMGRFSQKSTSKIQEMNGNNEPETCRKV
jgi:hypothetical protein